MEENNHNSIPITVVNDNIYKKISAKRKVFNHLFWLPFINYVPEKFGVWFFNKSSEHTRQITKLAKSSMALEMMYGYDGFKLNGNGFADSFFTSFWEGGTLNAHAVRNRFKLVKKELKEIFLKDNRQKIKILSLASGSARAIIEVLAELDGIEVEARFVDMSRDALDYSKGLAEKYQVTGQINWIRGNVTDINKLCGGWRPDVVEFVGLMDYLDEKMAIGMIASIHRHLENDGHLIFSNINHNKEKRFVDKIVNWDQIYRTPCQLGDLLLAGGFDGQHCRVLCEPIGIQTVAIARKA